MFLVRGEVERDGFEFHSEENEGDELQGERRVKEKESENKFFCLWV